MSQDYRILGASLFVARRESSQSFELPDTDEVSGGFPSMAQLVPRITDAFLDVPERSRDTQRKIVELTPREALQGTLVPLDLLVKPTCPICGGRGETLSGPCGLCIGTGSGEVPQRLKFSVPPGVRHGACLSFCVTSSYASEAHVELHIAVR